MVQPQPVDKDANELALKIEDYEIGHLQWHHCNDPLPGMFHAAVTPSGCIEDGWRLDGYFFDGKTTQPFHFVTTNQPRLTFFAELLFDDYQSSIPTKKDLQEVEEATEG